MAKGHGNSLFGVERVGWKYDLIFTDPFQQLEKKLKI